MAKVLSREDIKKKNDASSETIHVPEWGGDVIVKSLTGEERDKYESSILELHGTQFIPTLENARAKLVVLALVDENGEQLFEESDVEWLGKKSARALQRAFDKARELSGLKEEDIQELVKGLKPARSEGSTSD